MKSPRFWIAFLFLSVLLCVFLAQKIDPVTLDIGRHIASGNALLSPESFGISRSSVLNTNLFSYTNAEFPFVDHHWAGSVLLYLVFAFFGWTGLSLFYIFCILAGLFLICLALKDEVSPSEVFLGALILLPLIAERTDIRPEGLSYLLFSLFVFLLYSFSKQKIPFKILGLIPLLQIFWANSHIYYIFGPCIVFAFLFEATIRKEWALSKKYAFIFLLAILATAVTPFGLKSLWYPLTMFQNYGYRVAENQSIPFLEHLSFANPNFILFKIVVSCLLIYSVVAMWKKRRPAPIAFLGIALVFGVLAFFGIRHFTLFAFSALPLCMFAVRDIREVLKKTADIEILGATYFGSILLLLLFFSVHYSSRIWTERNGIGLAPHSFDSAIFARNIGLRGPIFNNYDIGGYLIYNFYPKEKVFVDNRPEAYPASFFTDVYVPMQEKKEVWDSTLATYKFNSIFFYRLDMTPWSQQFLLSRIDDPEWAPVYVDAETIIFLRRNAENKSAIEKYELPREIFGSTNL